MTGVKYKNLSSREKKKIVKTAIRAANADQLSLVERAKKSRFQKQNSAPSFVDNSK